MNYFTKYYHPAVHLWTLWFSEAMLKYLNKNDIKISSFDTVLDIGCGLGYHCIQLLKFKPQEIYGLDISADTILFLKEFSLEIEFAVLDISKGDISRYRNKLTRIFSSDVYEHVSNPYSMILNIYNMLVDNGVVCITFPNWDHHGQNQFQSVSVLENQIKQAGFKSYKINIIEDYSLVYKLFMKFYLIVQILSDKIFKIQRVVVAGDGMPKSDKCDEMYGFDKNLKLKNKKIILIAINITFQFIKYLTRITAPFKLSDNLSDVKNKRIIFLAIK